MHLKSSRFGNYRIAVIFFLGVLTSLPICAQLSRQAQEQINRQAASLASQPARISLTPVSQGVAVGKKSQVQVTLLTADNKPIAADQDRQVDVELQLPSGTKTTQKVFIRKGQTSGILEFSADEPGLASITARPATNDIRPANTDVLIVPATAAKKDPIRTKPTSQLAPFYDLQLDQVGRVEKGKAQLRLTRFELLQQPLESRQAPQKLLSGKNSPRLHISINDAGSDYIANGSDSAVISAYFESPTGAPAPQNINIWFTWSNGALNPQPLQIAKGSYSGVTKLTSNWPGDVHVSFFSSNPQYQPEGSTEFDIQFVPLGVVLAGPDKLSVIDNVPVWVVFINDRGPIAPGRDWKVTLRSSQSKLTLTPGDLLIKKDSPLGSALLFPKSIGSDTIEAVVSDYAPLPIKIVITWKLVLALCLGGGMLGGIAAYGQFKGSWFWRIFLGILGGALLCWLYVFLALQSVASGNFVGNVAHNTISVFFVAIVGGFLGIKVLDFIAKKLGWLK